MKKIGVIVLIVCFMYILPVKAIIKLPDHQYTHCESQDDKIFCVDEKNRPLTGKRYEYWDDGTLKSIESYKNGYRNGLSTFMNKSSITVERAYYKNGIKNGMDKYYYDNRTIKFWANYDEGLLDGRLDVYAKNGDLLGRMTYKKGYLKRGYCVLKGKKQDFTYQQLQENPFNHLKKCGVQ